MSANVFGEILFVFDINHINMPSRHTNAELSSQLGLSDEVRTVIFKMQCL